jgi:MFS family permease
VRRSVAYSRRSHSKALGSAAFILIGGKIAGLIGRKRAYILGLCGYGIGAALLLPGTQALIQGNLTGAAQ